MLDENNWIKILLQGDKITDEERFALNKIFDITNEEWLALGKAFKIDNILNKNKNERIYLIMSNLNFSGIVGGILNSSFSYGTSIWQMHPPEEEINKNFEDNIKILENKFYLTEEEKSICYVATKFFNKQNVAKNFLNELVELKNDYEKIKNFSSEVSKIYKIKCVALPIGLPRPISLKEILFGDNKKREMERKQKKFCSILISASLVIFMIKKRIFISEFFKEIDDGKIDNNI